MKQSFQGLEQSLSQTSAELISQMAEIQSLRLALIWAEARSSRKASFRGPKILSTLNQPQVEPS